jgi:hypothetical protein
MAQPFDMASLTATGEASGLGGEPALGDRDHRLCGLLGEHQRRARDRRVEAVMRMAMTDRSGQALRTFGSPSLRYGFVASRRIKQRVAADTVSQQGYQVFVFEPERNMTTTMDLRAGTGNFRSVAGGDLPSRSGRTATAYTTSSSKSSSGSSSDEVLLGHGNNHTFLMAVARTAIRHLWRRPAAASANRALWDAADDR